MNPNELKLNYLKNLAETVEKDLETLDKLFGVNVAKLENQKEKDFLIKLHNSVKRQEVSPAEAQRQIINFLHARKSKHTG